jgi:hypothetical protein
MRILLLIILLFIVSKVLDKSERRNNNHIYKAHRQAQGWLEDLKQQEKTRLK